MEYIIVGLFCLAAGYYAYPLVEKYKEKRKR